MTRKILLSTISATLLLASSHYHHYPTRAELLKRLNELQKEVQQLQEIIKQNSNAIQQTQEKVNKTEQKVSKTEEIEKKQKQLEEKIAKNERHIKQNREKINPFASNDHLYWGFDLRTSYDVINKETTGGLDASGKKVPAKTYAGQVLSNRVILSAMYNPSDDLKAHLKIEANKLFGGNNINQQNAPYTNYDWVANETPDDGIVRLKEAYFNYYFGPDNGLMFSAGRRPATEGLPMNLREDDLAESPLAHSINMEFDGFSFRIGTPIFAKLSDKFEDWGTTLKFCAGRGASNVRGKFTNGLDYTKQDGVDNADLVGIFFVPYNDEQYAIQTQTAWAFNLQGIDKKTNKMRTVGDFFLTDITLSAIGIGDGISDFLDDSTAYASFAYTRTHPKEYKMLGSDDKKSGTSVMIGADMPVPMVDDDRFGLTFVKGSKYWRSFTYGEDTLAGSIGAVRGNAYDVYYIHHIIPHLSAQIRYTYLDYKYPGSEAFFGDMGDPTATDSNYVKTAKDLRFYIRYRF